MSFPKIEIIAIQKPNFLEKTYSGILFFKQEIRQNIQHNFLPPKSSVLQGMILGDNGAMDNDLKGKLNITGLRHIISVSGTHVIILSSIIMLLMLSAGLGRHKSFYIAVIFICIYIALTGMPASGIRAGIMGILFLLAQKLGRQAMGVRIIVLAAALMLAVNPLLLMYDVGFQLSFLAVIGLIYVEPIIKYFINKFIKTLGREDNKNPFLENIVGIVSTTFAAQVFTVPIMVYNFGNISFVSPITNLLILPVVYWLMVFGFLVSVLGIFSNILGWVLSLPCWFLLNYFLGVIDIFSKPWMIKSISNVNPAWLFISYFLISCVTWFLNKKYSQKIV